MAKTSIAFLLMFASCIPSWAIDDNLAEIEILKERIGKVEQSLKKVVTHIADDVLKQKTQNQLLNTIEKRLKNVSSITRKLSQRSVHGFHHNHFHSSSKTNSTAAHESHLHSSHIYDSDEIYQRNGHGYDSHESHFPLDSHSYDSYESYLYDSHRYLDGQHGHHRNITENNKTINAQTRYQNHNYSKHGKNGSDYSHPGHSLHHHRHHTNHHGHSQHHHGHSQHHHGHSQHHHGHSQHHHGHNQHHHEHSLHHHSSTYHGHHAPHDHAKIIREYGEKYVLARCDMAPNTNLPEYKKGNGIKGHVYFREQRAGSNKTAGLEMLLQLSGFPAKSGHIHGFHVHEFGNLSKGCDSTGPHYNPTNMQHGGKDAEIRHIGDLGNIECDSKGELFLKTRDKVASLQGQNSIIGRSLVIHLNKDDEGKNKDIPSSLTTGNSGPRIACCLIKEKKLDSQNQQ